MVKELFTTTSMSRCGDPMKWVSQLITRNAHFLASTQNSECVNKSSFAIDFVWCNSNLFAHSSFCQLAHYLNLNR